MLIYVSKIRANGHIDVTREEVVFIRARKSRTGTRSWVFLLKLIATAFTKLKT